MHGTAERRVRSFQATMRECGDDERLPRDDFDLRHRGPVDGASLRALLVCQELLKPASGEPKLDWLDKPTLRLDERGKRAAARRTARGLAGQHDEIGDDALMRGRGR
jgi:hypothetical protein